MSDQVTASRNEWMARVLGVRISTVAPQPGDDAATLIKRLSVLNVKAKAQGALAELQGEIRACGVAIKGGEVGRAQELIRLIEDRLAGGTQAAGGSADTDRVPEDEAALEPPPSPEAMADAVRPRLALREAESAYELAVDNLAAAFRATLRTEAFVDDPLAETDETQQAIDDIGQRVPDIGPVTAAVLDTIEKLKTATESEQAKLAAPALTAIRNYRKALDNESLLREMEHTDAGSFPIHSALTAALDDLAAALRG